MMLLQGCADDGQAVPYRDLLLADNVVFYRTTRTTIVLFTTHNPCCVANARCCVWHSNIKAIEN